ANTMQVLLRRRQREVAVWKALGYQERQLQAMFALEAAVLGTLGSLAGAGAGVLVSTRLVELFRRTTNLLFSWAFAPEPVLAGVGAGILTTVVFALWAIVAASQAQPMALLRNEPVNVRRLPWLKAAGLALLLALPFTLITSLVMGSLGQGIGVLLFAVAGLAVLGGLFGGLLWAAARLVPLRRLPLVHLAQNSLRRRGLALVFAMIALFAGVVAMTLGVAFTQNAQREMDERTIEIEGYNVNVIARSRQEAAVRQAVDAEPVEKSAVGYAATVQEIRLTGSSEEIQVKPLLIGRSDPFDYLITGSPWGSRPEGAYVDQNAGIPAGSRLEVRRQDGLVRTLEVVGTYEINGSPGTFFPQAGVLVPAEGFSRIAAPDTVTVFVQAPKGEAANIAARLGAALPEATVIDLVAYATRYTQTYQNLFMLATAMAGLAFLAGVLLVANSVSLAMLDRRYELGILKAVGYSRLHLLATLAVEYSLMALLACATGLAAVRIFLWVLALANHLAGSLVLTPGAAGLIGLCGVGLTLITVLGVTWGPTRVSPMAVLNERI
ncbi:MAG: FtsX-like permease family protein, partial [Chloroflexota bacterium]